MNNIYEITHDVVYVHPHQQFTKRGKVWQVTGASELNAIAKLGQLYPERTDTSAGKAYRYLEITGIKKVD